MVKPLTHARAAAILSAAAGKRVLVVGDVILDHYVEGTVTRVSPEAPVPVLKVEREWWALGGAANVAANISVLGGETKLCTITGGDCYLTKLCSDARIDIAGIHRTGFVTVKTRYLTPQQPLLRVDKENTTPISQSACETLRVSLTEQIDSADTVVVSDYAKGVVTQELLDMVSELCVKHNNMLCIGPKPRPAIKYPNPIGWHCLNLQEAESMLVTSDMSVLLRTEGKNGITVLDGLTGNAVNLPSLAQYVVDVCGAGDTVLAMVAMARLGGATPVEAAQLANVAAAVVVGKKGTATASVEEVLALLI